MTPRLFARVLSLEARKMMSYRVDFWANSVVSFAVEMVVAYSLWLAIFAASGSETIGGFGFDGMVMYYVLAILTAKLVRGQERNLPMARDIYEGSLTHYLIYPARYSGFKYAENLGALVPAMVQVVVFGLLAFFWLPRPAELTIDGGSILLAIPALVGANILMFALCVSVQGVAFWADNVWSLNVMVRLASDLLGGLLLPLSVFPAGLREVLEWLPFRYFFSFPVETLLGRSSLEEWLQGMVVLGTWIVLLSLLGRFVWRRGEKVYTGVGI